MARLSPTARLTLRMVGFVLVGLGAASFIYVLVNMATGFENAAGNPVATFILFGFGGIFLLAAGSFCLQVGFLKVAADIVSTETAGAVEYSAGAVGRGLKGASAGPIVKLKCRACGFLESEDARFCSSCGKAV